MPIDLLTRQDADALHAKLDQVLQAVAAGANAASELLTLDEVAAYTKFERRTVRGWVANGAYNQAGKRVYLPALRFGELLRFRRSDVEAFGVGVGLLAPAKEGGQLTATRQPRPKKTALSSADALRVAS